MYLKKKKQHIPVPDFLFEQIYETQEQPPEMFTRRLTFLEMTQAIG